MMNEINDFLQEMDPEEVQLTPADESAIALEAIKDMCTPEEYNRIVTESATELELYGIIDSATIATEAKTYRIKITKQTEMSRETKRAAIRLAARANCNEFTQYSKYRKLYREWREKIYTKFGSKAKQEARAIVNNTRRKASSMNSPTGKSIVDKMDKKIAEASKENK